MERLIINAATREKRAAVIDQQQVQELMIDQPNQDRILGNIYKAKVEKVLPGMQAAFLNIGRDKNAYLHRDDVLTFYVSSEDASEKRDKSISHYIQQGQEVVVQVIKEEIGSKGARVTGVVTVPGHHFVYLPHSGYIAVSKRFQSEEKREQWRDRGKEWTTGPEGLIIRTAAENVPTDHLLSELETLRQSWEEASEAAKKNPVPSIVLRAPDFVEQVVRDYAPEGLKEIVVDSTSCKKQVERILSMMNIQLPVHVYRGNQNIFTEYAVDRQLDLAMRQRIWLKSGAFLVFDQTEAMTVIDVNSGKFTGKTNLDDTVMKVNIEAAHEITRQLKLRDIGGIVIIDFIDIRNEQKKKELIQTLEKLLKSDRTQTKVRGLTQLGLLELTRKKVRESLRTSLTTLCETCKGTGTVLSDQSLAFQIERELWEYRGQGEAALVEIPMSTERILFGDQNEHKNRLEEVLGFRIFAKRVPSIENHSYGVTYVGSTAEAERLL